MEILEKICPNTYWLKFPSHIKTSDIFNIKHLIPFTGASFDEDANSRLKSLQPGENNVDHSAWEIIFLISKDSIY